MPGDRIEVELDYSELLVPEDAIYEFVYPTVVGPRYAGGADPQERPVDGQSAPARRARPSPTPGTSRSTCRPASRLKELSSPSHKIAVNYAGPATRRRHASTRAGRRQQGLRAALPAGRRQDRDRPPAVRGAARRQALPGRELLRPAWSSRRSAPDRWPTSRAASTSSCSTCRARCTASRSTPPRTLMRNLLAQLRPTDHFNIVLFSGANYVWSPQGLASRPREDNIARRHRRHREAARRRRHRADGRPASRATRIPPVGKRRVAHRRRRHRRLRRRRGAGLPLHPRAPGSRPTCSPSASAAASTAASSRAWRAPGRASRSSCCGPRRPPPRRRSCASTSSSRCSPTSSVAFSGFDAYEVAPEKMPDLLARRPLVLFGKYRGSAGGRIEIKGTQRRRRRGARSSTCAPPTCAPRTRRCAGCGRASGSRCWTTSAHGRRQGRSRTPSPTWASSTAC